MGVPPVRGHGQDGRGTTQGDATMRKTPVWKMRGVWAIRMRTVWALTACLAISGAMGFGQSSAIRIENDSHHTVQYQYGEASSIESFENGRWMARNWGFPYRELKLFGNQPAFEIRVKTKPSPGSVPGLELSTWDFVSAQEIPTAQSPSRHAVVELASRQLPITVKVHTLLDGTPVLTRWLEITNRSARPVALSGLFVIAGQLWRGDAVADVGYATRYDWQREGWFGWKRLAPGTFRLQQEHGLSFDHPYFLLRNETDEEYFFGEMEWPLNRITEFYDDHGVSFKMGPTAANALRVIAPGETVTSPKVHLGHTRGTFDAAVQGMHDHIRRSVLYPRKPALAYRIELLMPEDWGLTLYRGEQFNETNIEKIIDAAAQLGVELYILDGPTWCQTYGDWLKPQPKEFPHGLKPISDFAHQHHVLFGLYAEPEGGRESSPPDQNGLAIGSWKNSAVFQQHPDWFPEVTKMSEPRALGPDDPRVCPLLNLANPAAAAYLRSTLEAMVTQYGLDLYRNDFNSPLKGEGLTMEREGFVEAEYWPQYQAWHEVYDRLHHDFPDLILQQASAGGTRMDLGTLRRFSENYTSDRVTMPFVYRMLAGYSVYLPPEALVTPIGLANPRDLPDLDTMLRSIFALGNTPMIFNSLIPKSAEEITPEIRAKFLHYTTLYKDMFRPMLPTLQVYHHAPVNAEGGVDSGDWFAMEFGSPDRRQDWAVVVRLSPKAPEDYLLKPRGLDPSREYEITFDSTGAKTRARGGELARQGLRIKPANGTISELVLLKAQGGQ
jgi:alpha-galactosidase